MSIRWWIGTPAGRAGAIATIALEGDRPEDLDSAINQLDLPATETSTLRVGVAAGIDRCVLARWTPTRADLMPHGGVAVLRALADELSMRFGSGTEPRSASAYPESETDLDTRVLGAISIASSPRAIEILLSQPSRWAAADAGPMRAERARELWRLVDPPLVVSVGPANVGKSSLLNALAGQQAAIVADVPGTTRDHVGASLDLDGLVVRYIDTPGFGAPEPIASEREALAHVGSIVARADLVVSCFDASAGPVPVGDKVLAVRVQTRADLGEASEQADVVTSVRTGEGIGALTRLIRQTLVSDEALADPRPWAFWDAHADLKPDQDPQA